MDLFRKQEMPPSIRQVQFQARTLSLLLDQEDNRSLPGSLEIRLGAWDLLEYLDQTYPPQEPKQPDLFPPSNSPKPPLSDLCRGSLRESLRQNLS